MVKRNGNKWKLCKKRVEKQEMNPTSDRKISKVLQRNSLGVCVLVFLMSVSWHSKGIAHKKIDVFAAAIKSAFSLTMHACTIYARKKCVT